MTVIKSVRRVVRHPYYWLGSLGGYLGGFVVYEVIL